MATVFAVQYESSNYELIIDGCSSRVCGVFETYEDAVEFIYYKTRAYNICECCDRKIKNLKVLICSVCKEYRCTGCVNEKFMRVCSECDNEEEGMTIFEYPSLAEKDSKIYRPICQECTEENGCDDEKNSIRIHTHEWIEEENEKKEREKIHKKGYMKDKNGKWNIQKSNIFKKDIIYS